MRLFITFVLFTSLTMDAMALTTMHSEEQYHSFSDDLKTGEDDLDLITGTNLSLHSKKILVDSLWDFVASPDNSKILDTARTRWRNLDFVSMRLPEQIRLFILGIKLQGSALRLDNMKAVLQDKIKGKLDNRSLILIFNHLELLQSEGLDKNTDEVEIANIKLKIEYDKIKNSGNENLSENELKEVFQVNKKLDRTFIYIVCRSSRSIPCLLVLKDSKGNVAKNEDGEIWSLPVLTKSKLGLTFNYENGNTPNGFYIVDSVMPEADRQHEFGVNRRLIVKMTDQASALRFLPASQLKRSWWKQLLLALELGRENLRIHGTGKKNTELESLHPTLVPSMGCVKLREGKYDGVVYNDQRLLLNMMLKLQQLKVSKLNEPSLKAYMLIFNLPGSGNITTEDIKDYIEEKL